ncbi:MAG: hypothetical protein JRH18_03235 [Deltaproteobacteria bacterium]|nr:hypothetical protein [Deltaproteobacteria bacterium]MBW1960547.1 hypothetical protein [Deltaproteobacteria bacterium]MBW1994658.1 hypothetical protein [Deltaproteobacteria bacterium]MBW2150662.1 hypothetical protein [Deltaproteobacteria bacterium]
MKKLENQLKSIAKSLATLSKQVDKVSTQVGKLQPAKSAPAKKSSAPRASSKKENATGKKGVLNTVLGIISRSKKGVNITTIKDKTGFDSKQLSNALYKLTKKGRIKTLSRGVYVKN